MAKDSGKFVGTPYNQVASEDPNSPDISGAGLYVSYEEVIAAQLSDDGADLSGSENSRASHGIFGGPAPGEPNPADMVQPGANIGRK
jgi:hypothetical protein